MPVFSQQLKKIQQPKGFIAALDQSCEDIPKALRLYDINSDQYDNNEEILHVAHKMRTRIITSPSFTGQKILGAILSEDTLDRTIAEKKPAQFLWETLNIVPFLKVDNGLANEKHDVQLMRDIPNLQTLLQKAKANNIFGAKIRSLIKLGNAQGIADIVAQQFSIGKEIITAGLVPILQLEIDIHSPEKIQAEVQLRRTITSHLQQLSANEKIILKLTLPEVDDFYTPFNQHINVHLVAALSGGHTRSEASRRLTKNHGMIASFSRALTENLSVRQSSKAFDQQLDSAIEEIYLASIAAADKTATTKD